MRAMPPRREVSIFSMSFLDILACTLGGLVFIMILLFLQLSDLVEESPESRKRREDDGRMAELGKRAGTLKSQESALSEDAPEAERRAAELRRERERVAEEARKAAELAGLDAPAAEARLREESRSLDRQVSESEREREEMERKARAAEERARRTREELGRLGVVTPYAPPGRNDHARHITDLYHVLCERDAVVITHVRKNEKGEYLLRGALSNRRVPANRLADAGADLQIVLQRLSETKSHSMILWVRPDGMRTYDRVLRLLREPMQWGDEPADADWKFTFGGER